MLRIQKYVKWIGTALHPSKNLKALKMSTCLETMKINDGFKASYSLRQMWRNDTLERQHGLNQYDFGARWYDPAHPGTTTMDPLCEQRPWESPYLWCAGNPVRNIDPDGRWVVGTNKKRVHFNEKTGKWPKNASSDVIRIGNAMRQTEIGKKKLNELLSAKYPITLDIDEVTLHKVGDNEAILGTTNTAVYKDKYGNAINFKRVSITIYLRAIQEFAKNDPRYTGMSDDEIIGANGVHEGTHGTEKMLIVILTSMVDPKIMHLKKK